MSLLHRFFVFFIACLITGSALGQEITIETFDLEKDDGRFTLSTRILPQGTFFGDIHVPTEGLFLSVDPPVDDIVRESDFLGVGLPLDLNADGDETDLFRVFKKEGELFVETLAVKPFGRENDTQETAGAQVYRLTEEGPGMVFYFARPRLVLGLDHHGKKAGFVTLPNPFFQILLVEPCEGPSGPPGLVLEGAEGFSFTFEPGISGPEPSWARVQWLACPPGEERKYTITGKGSGILMGIVNMSTEPGVRVRGERVMRKLTLP